MSPSAKMEAAADDLVQDPKQILQKAIQRFQGTFTAEERARMRSSKTSETLIAYMRGLAQPCFSLAKVPSSVDAFCKAVSDLSNCLEPYFACISTFVQTNPDISGLIWGTIQFLFQLCRNYTSFLDKVAKIIYEVTQEIQLKDKITSAAIKKERQSSEFDSNCPSSLTAAITTLYSDLLELLCIVCQLFPKEGGKPALLAGKAFWVPFDEHFAHFQQKFAAHKEILVAELDCHSETSRMKAYMNLKRLNEETFQHLRSVQTSLKHKRLASLKVWLNPPSWTARFEESKKRRFRDTSEWILRHDQYQWWSRPLDKKHHTHDPAADFMQSPRILSIQAKPGYGKSVLCGVIVQHLQQGSTNKKPNKSDKSHAVGYYFFDKQRSFQSDHTWAMRALITQLLHQHQDMPDLIDLSSIMRDHSSSGVSTASSDDLKDLLSMFLRKFEESSLILDGLDECDNLGHFLAELEDIVRFSKTRILFSSTPNVDFSGHFKDRKTLLLEEAANLQDIEAYLLPEINSLVSSDMLKLDDDAENIAHLMAQNSRSTFLWASLLVNHLKSDLMTPQDRMDAINDMNLFPDLNLLYARILSKIISWNTTKAGRRNLQALFDWLCGSARPLSATELRSAIAVQVGSETKRSRRITHFDRTVAKMTGALVEISSDHTVRFIHTSALEFFMSSVEDRAAPKPENGQLKIDPDTIHCSIAAACLSYLIFDAPKKPILSAFGALATRQSIASKCPLLLYSTQFWAYHAFQAVGKWTPVPGKPNAKATPSMKALVNTLIMFLSDKLAVTSWTELAWKFGSEPCLSGLPSRAGTLALHIDSTWGEKIKCFCKDVIRLNSEWAHVLRENPSEIWEPSILAFLKSSFWVETTDRQVTSLNETENFLEASKRTLATDSMLVASQCSADGSRVGLIKLWPSSKFRREITKEIPDLLSLFSTIDELSQEWEIAYEIKTIQHQRTVYNIRLKMPPEQVRQVLQTAFQTQEPKSFRFPVSLSADLSQITVLGYLIRVLPDQVHKDARVPSRYNFAVQDLGIYRSISPQNCPLREDHDTLLSESHCPCSYSWYHITFSPSSKYLVVLRGPGRPTNRHLFAKMDFTAYRDISNSLLQPKFVVVGQTLSNVSPDKSAYKFHPTLPVLIVSRLAVTALWFFEEQGSNMRTIIERPLPSLSFSRCGNYIHGERHRRYGPSEVIVVRITKELEKFQSTISSHPVNQPSQSLKRYPGQHGIVPRAQQAINVLALGNAPEALESGQIVFGMQENSRQVSMARQYHRTGEVVLERVSQDGKIASECVTKLPVSASLDKSYATVLNVFNRDDDMQVILNKAAEDTYSIDTAHNSNGLPLLITRKRESIPQYSGKRSLLVEDRCIRVKRRRGDKQIKKEG